MTGLSPGDLHLQRQIPISRFCLWTWCLRASKRESSVDLTVETLSFFLEMRYDESEKTEKKLGLKAMKCYSSFIQAGIDRD